MHFILVMVTQCCRHCTSQLKLGPVWTNNTAELEASGVGRG